MRDEIKTYFKKDSFQNLTPEEWRQVFTQEELSNLKYLTMCLNETLRLEPPLRIPSLLSFQEDVDVGGYKIPANTAIGMNIWQMHRSPKQWQKPDEFIPERFDPESELSLTPQGGKRHPFAFGPYLGGKRICLGKTFAEHLGRSIVGVIVSQLDFEFNQKSDYERKLTNAFHSIEPVTNVRVTLAQ